MFKHIRAKNPILVLALAVIIVGAVDTAHPSQQTNAVPPIVTQQATAIPLPNAQHPTEHVTVDQHSKTVQAAQLQTHAQPQTHTQPQTHAQPQDHAQPQTHLPSNSIPAQPVNTNANQAHIPPTQQPSQQNSHEGPTIPIEPFVPNPQAYQFQSELGHPASPTGEEIALEQQQEKEQADARQAQLPIWIAEEMREYNNEPKNIISESFNMVLSEGEEVVYKWDPSKIKQLKLNVLVYELSNQGDVSFIRQGEEDQYVEVFLRNEDKSVYTHLGNVYINRLFRVNFDTDYKYLRFVNKNPFMIALTVDVEQPQAIPPNNAVSDGHLSIPAQKLAAIHKEMLSGEVSREHQYKYEWGFEEKQLTHDSRLLGLTAVELVIILATGIVQMYFVKTLLDNRAVV